MEARRSMRTECRGECFTDDVGGGGGGGRFSVPSVTECACVGLQRQMLGRCV